MYQLSTIEYNKEANKIANHIVQEIRDDTYNRVYELVASHTDDPDSHDRYISELVDIVLETIKENL